MRRAGFLLVTVLLFITVLMLLGIGFLGSQAARYRSVTRASEAAQARALAMAGLEDARVKWENDLHFPPRSGPGQVLFSYSEFLNLPDGTSATYSVTVDRSHALPPYEVWTITSVGSIGPTQAPIAQHTLKAELDVAPERPTGHANPRFFRFTHLEDEGSL